VASSLGRAAQKPIRLVVSGVIIICSIVGAWWLIDSSKATKSYLITKQNLATGSYVQESSFATSELALFGIGDNYLQKGELPPGSYLSRSVFAGEVIPKSAVTTQALDDWSNIVITPAVELSSAIRPGSKVLVWASPALDYQSFGEPLIVAVDVEVVEIREPKGNFSQGQNSVELRVPIEALQSLLRSISNGDAIALTATGETLSK
jgi:hypothetical protein